MAKLLLGKEVTDALNEKLMERTAALKERGIIPTLAPTPAICPMRRAPPSGPNWWASP